jgi:hypothetical protein
MMDPGDLDLIDWPVIERLTSTPVFEKLDQIRFTIFGGVDVMDIQRLITLKLTRCSERGILKFGNK